MPVIITHTTHKEIKYIYLLIQLKNVNTTGKKDSIKELFLVTVFICGDMRAAFGSGDEIIDHRNI